VVTTGRTGWQPVGKPLVGFRGSLWLVLDVEGVPGWAGMDTQEILDRYLRSSHQGV
jgi:hypothetical protein